MRWSLQGAEGVQPDDEPFASLVEAALEIDDVMGNADPGSHAARVVQVVDRAARPETHLSIALVVQLHGQTDHLVSLPREERGRDRGVDAAGHRHHHAHRTTVSLR